MKTKMPNIFWRFIAMQYILLYIFITMCFAEDFFENPQGPTALYISFFIKFALNVVMGIVLSYCVGMALKNKYLLTTLLITFLILSYIPILYWALTGISMNIEEPWNAVFIFLVRAKDFMQITLGYVLISWRNRQR